MGLGIWLEKILAIKLLNMLESKKNMKTKMENIIV